MYNLPLIIALLHLCLPMLYSRHTASENERFILSRKSMFRMALWRTPHIFLRQLLSILMTEATARGGWLPKPASPGHLSGVPLGTTFVFLRPWRKRSRACPQDLSGSMGMPITPIAKRSGFMEGLSHCFKIDWTQNSQFFLERYLATLPNKCSALAFLKCFL